MQLCAAKLHPTPHEESVIAVLNAAAGTVASKQRGRKKKKKPKAPNPLSVKKTRKVLGGSSSLPGALSQSKVGVSVYNTAYYCN